MANSPKIAIDQEVLKSVADRIARRCDELAKHTDDAEGLTRTFCSRAMKSAHEELKTWMQATLMDCVLDESGNLIGRYVSPKLVAGQNEPEQIFMIGSHLDTVVNAGRFDGMLGVLLGVGVVEMLHETNFRLPFQIHVVAFSEEEGVRFRFPFIGSQGVTGTLEQSTLKIADDEGISMWQALKDFGCEPDQIETASYRDKKVIGFMEAHIEQAVTLEEENIPVGIVSAIAGQTRATISIEGHAGHAGTVPHNRRRDALAAAAELILQIETLGQATDGLFATVGNVIASPGLSNVISGLAELRLDLRHESDNERELAFEKIQSILNRISKSRSVTVTLDSVQHSPAVPMDSDLAGHLESAINDIGIEPKTMVSGAGHDAMVMSTLAPSCMLFVRCKNGISHHPDEYVSPKDIRSALEVMVSALIRRAVSKH